MLTLLPSAVRIFVAADPVDMRKSHHALAAIVSDQLRLDPLAGHLYFFVNRPRTMCKILFFDRSGLAILFKKLEGGTFQLPTMNGQGQTEVDPASLSMILGGIDLRTATRRKRFFQAARSVGGS
jgi:transposase